MTNVNHIINFNKAFRTYPINICFIFFLVVMHKDKEEGGGLHRQRDLTAFDHTPLDGEMFLQVTNRLQTFEMVTMRNPILQALNGFLMILTCEGEVFFATHSIEGYLGFHQVTESFSNSFLMRKYIFLFTVGYRSSISVRVGSFRRQGRTATTVNVEFLPASRIRQHRTSGRAAPR